jgi:hypothetical protein
MRGLINVSSVGTTGCTYLIMRPPSSSAVGYRVRSTTSGTTYPAGDVNYDSNIGTFPSFISEARCVSAGIRWHCTLPLTGEGGTVSVIPLADDTTFLDGNTHGLSDLLVTPGVEIANIRDPGVYVFPVLEPTLANQFQAVSSNAATGLNAGFGGVILCFNGPLTSYFSSVEFVFHYEGVIDETVNFGGGKKQPGSPMLEYYRDNSPGGYLRGASDHIMRMLKDRAISFAKRYGVQFARTAANAMLPGLGNAAYMLTNAIPDVD